MQRAQLKAVSENVAEAAVAENELELRAFDANSLISEIAVKSGKSLIYLQLDSYNTLKKLYPNEEFGINLFRNLRPTFLACNDINYASQEYDRMKSVIKSNCGIEGGVKLALYYPDGHYFITERTSSGFLMMSER